MDEMEAVEQANQLETLVGCMITSFVHKPGELMELHCVDSKTQEMYMVHIVKTPYDDTPGAIEIRYE